METEAEQEYSYVPLADPLKDIRLVELLQGDPGDRLRIQFVSPPAVPVPTKSPDNRVAAVQLQQLLPEDWTVHVTLEGRYIFKNRNNQGLESWQWACPAEGIPDSAFQYPGDGSQDFESSYEALSYTWGNRGIKGKTFIEVHQAVGDGSYMTRKLQVPENLPVALRHLRRPHASRMLWIDALCINQNDEDEKSSQVRRMGSIYGSAKNVIAWLGLEGDSSSLAIQTLQHIGHQLEYIEGGDLCPSPDAVEHDWHKPSKALPYDSKTWDAVYALLCRDWFDRVWVVQEILLADTRAVMQCGFDSIPFVVFRKAATCIKENNHTLKLELRLRHLAKLTNPCTGLSFDRVVRLGYERSCKDPRDYVYGVMGMAPARLAAKLRPNYHHSVSQVFTNTALVYSEHVQRLDILQGACQYGRRITELPSWVPDLTASLIKRFPCNGQFSAGFSRAHFTFTAPNKLTALGLQCATVTTVSWKLLSEGENARSTIRAWQPDNMSTKPYPHGETLQRAHLMTLRKGRVRERWVGWKRIYPSIDNWELAWMNFANDKQSEQDEKSPEMIRSTNRHVDDIINFSIGHSYVQTDKGYVGLVPLDVRIGDVICIIMGCDFPVLLREQEQGRFIVVGECFVFGLHDAISLLGPLPAGWDVQMFKSFGNRYKYRFYNEQTGECVQDDPRLADVSLGEWQRLAHEPESDDPPIFDYFQNRTTGEVMNSDPRMLPERMEARGVQLQWFTLI